MAVLHRGGIQLKHQRAVVASIGLLGLALGVAFVAASCEDSGPLKDLRAMPAAAIQYPGSKVVQEVATPRVDSPDGKDGAAFGHLVGVNATPDEVLGFFDRELTSRGWRTSTPGTGTNELKVATWTNGSTTFRLAINLPESMTQAMQQALAGYSLEYDARLIEIWPPRSPSPT